MLKIKLAVITLVSLLFLSACVDKKYVPVPEIVGCPQFQPLALPDSIEWAFEPVGNLDIIDKNVSQAVLYRDLSNTGIGSHSLKDASIMQNDLIYKIYEYYGYMYNYIDDYNKQVAMEQNASKELK